MGVAHQPSPFGVPVLPSLHPLYRNVPKWPFALGRQCVRWTGKMPAPSQILVVCGGPVSLGVVQSLALFRPSCARLRVTSPPQIQKFSNSVFVGPAGFSSSLYRVPFLGGPFSPCGPVLLVGGCPRLVPGWRSPQQEYYALSIPAMQEKSYFF